MAGLDRLKKEKGSSVSIPWDSSLAFPVPACLTTRTEIKMFDAVWKARNLGRVFNKYCLPKKEKTPGYPRAFLITVTIL